MHAVVFHRPLHCFLLPTWGEKGRGREVGVGVLSPFPWEPINSHSISVLCFSFNLSQTGSSKTYFMSPQKVLGEIKPQLDKELFLEFPCFFVLLPSSFIPTP